MVNFNSKEATFSKETAAVAGVNEFACPKTKTESSAQQKAHSQNCPLHMNPADIHLTSFPHLPLRTPITLIEPRPIPRSCLILQLGTMHTLPAQLHLNLFQPIPPRLERDIRLWQAWIAQLRESLNRILPRALELQLGVVQPLADVLAVRGVDERTALQNVRALLQCVHLLRRSFAGFLLDEVLAVGADLESTHHDVVVPGIVPVAEDDTESFPAEEVDLVVVGDDGLSIEEDVGVFQSQVVGVDHV